MDNEYASIPTDAIAYVSKAISVTAKTGRAKKFTIRCSVLKLKNALSTVNSIAAYENHTKITAKAVREGLAVVALNGEAGSESPFM